MENPTRLLDEMKDLYTKVVGQPAPRIPPDSYAPFPPGARPLEQAAREVEYLKQMTQQIASATAGAAWIPRADWLVTQDSQVLRIDVPGLEKEDVEVFVSGGECVVRGEVKAQDESELRPVSLERPWGVFERRFALPMGTVSDDVTATYRNGVLELRIPTKEPSSPVERKVTVS